MRHESQAGRMFPIGATSPAFLAIPFLLVWCFGVSGCGPPEEQQHASQIAQIDTVLMELGGRSTAELSRGQRWRMVASIGAGLPPVSYKQADLPEPNSRGAGLLTAYCVQCHWLPSPKMHAADEWPLLLRRMELRVETLGDHMGGAMTEHLMGDVTMSGFASSYLPEPSDVDSLLAYLQRNALPTVDPGELEAGPESRFFVEKCSLCHQTPSPDAHTAAEWEATVARMQANRQLTGMDPMSDSEQRRIVAYLAGRS